MKSTIVLHDKQSGYAHSTYEITVPHGHDVTSTELLTRCDNRTFDLSQPAGQRCHFGGSVEKIDVLPNGDRTFKVRVHED